MWPRAARNVQMAPLFNITKHREHDIRIAFHVPLVNDKATLYFIQRKTEVLAKGNEYGYILHVVINVVLFPLFLFFFFFSFRFVLFSFTRCLFRTNCTRS